MTYIYIDNLKEILDSIKFSKFKKLHISSLSSLFVKYNLNNIALTNRFNSLTNIEIININVEEITIDVSFPNLKLIICKNCNLKLIKINKRQNNLKILDLSDNVLTEFNDIFKHIPNIVDIRLNNNKLEEIHINKLEFCKNINLNHNLLTIFTIKHKKCLKLKNIYLIGNMLKTTTNTTFEGTNIIVE